MQGSILTLLFSLLIPSAFAGQPPAPVNSVAGLTGVISNSSLANSLSGTTMNNMNLISPQFSNNIPIDLNNPTDSNIPNFTNGLMIHGDPNGYQESSANLSITSYNDNGYSQVNGGYSTLSNRHIGLYGGIDAVNEYNEINSPSLIASISGVTFDSTHSYLPSGSCLTPTQILKTKYGTWLQTTDENSPTSNPHSGMVTSVSGDGCTLTVDGWTLQTGGVDTPSGSHSMSIGVVTALWNQNDVMGISANSQIAVGFIAEYDILNNKGNFNPTFGNTDYRGIDIISKGSYNVHSGFSVSSTSSSNGIYDGFIADDTTDSAFLVKNSDTGTAFKSEQASGNFLQLTDTTGTTNIFVVDNSGNLTTTGSVHVSTVTGGLVGLYGNLNGTMPTTQYLTLGWNYSAGTGEDDIADTYPKSSDTSSSFVFYQYTGSSETLLAALGTITDTVGYSAYHGGLTLNNLLTTYTTTNHLSSISGSPTISTCGSTTSTISGSSDLSGAVNIPVGSTSCTITFKSSYSSLPFITVSAVGANVSAYISNISTTSFVINIPSEASATQINYIVN